MAVVGNCVACKTALDSTRILGSGSRETGAAAGIDTMVELWTHSFSCPGCLSVIAVEEGLGSVSLSLVTKGTVVTRLRERLAASREAGSLAKDVAGLSPDDVILLGTPEIFAEIAADAFGRRLRLTAVVVPATIGGYSDYDRMLEEKNRPSFASVGKGGEENAIPARTALTLLGMRDGGFLCEVGDGSGRRLIVSRTLCERAD